jgi:simple sugar transport system permease protein
MMFQKKTRGILLSLIFIFITFFGIFLCLLPICQSKNLSIVEIFNYFLYSTITSPSGLAQTLMKTTPLLITSLGLCIAFKARVWNIGAEGQIAFGVIASLGTCLFLPLPGIIKIILAIVFSLLLGAAWGGVAGYLKSRWSVPEIPITLMQNFVALALMDFLIAGPWLSSQPGYAHTDPLPLDARLPYLAYPLNSSFLLGIILVPIVFWIMKRSVFGFQLKATGYNPIAANYGGINVKKIIVMSMFVSGGICALAGTSLVLGEFFFGVKGVTGNYGFYAIVSTLIARLDPKLTPFTSFFVALVLVGTNALTLKGIPGPFVHLSVGILFIGAVLIFLLEKVIESGGEKNV